MSTLHEIARVLVAPGLGILAADESITTMSARLEGAGVAASAEARRDYRELLLTAPGLSNSVSGIILCEETLGQSLADGTPFPQAAAQRGVLAGIKVDAGTTALAFADGGLITEGLDGLRGRLERFRGQGARFAKWRAVLTAAGLSDRTVRANAHALARYAALCQENDIVPIVEPEVLMDGSHSVAMCQAATSNTLAAVFEELELAGVDPAGIVLKPNMVIAARGQEPNSAQDVAARTVEVLVRNVPAAVPGIAFLSGGQSNEQACANLAAINARAAAMAEPPAWRLTFSFGRALVDDALKTWRGQVEQVEAAQRILLANCAHAAAATRPAVSPVPVGG